MLVFLSLFIFFLHSIQASSLSVRMDQDGLNLATGIGREVAEKAIRTWHVDYHIDGNTLRDCDWRTVQLPKVKTAATGDVTTEGGLITTRCHVIVKVPMGKIGGDVELLLGGLNTAISLRTNKTTGELELASCQAVLGALDVQRVHGGIAVHILKQLFAGKLGKALRHGFNKRACETIAKNINKVNSWLFPVTKDHQKIFTVEYNGLSLNTPEKALEATANIAFHYGKGQVCRADFKQKMASSDSKMLSLGFSEPVAQCLLKASHESKSLWYRVNTTDPKIAGYFGTTCGRFEACIGRIFPEMQAKYPNRTVDVIIYTSKAPEVIVVSGSVRILVYTTFNITINQSLLVQINYDAVINLQKPQIHNSHFYLLPTTNYRNLAVVSSKVGYPGYVKRLLLGFGLTWSLNYEGYKFWTDGYNLSDFRYGNWHLGEGTEINLLKGYASVGLEFTNTTLFTENWDRTSSYGTHFSALILSMFVSGILLAVGRHLWKKNANRDDTVPLIDENNEKQK